jgi:hypothetical protein
VGYFKNEIFAVKSFIEKIVSPFGSERGGSSEEHRFVVTISGTMLVIGSRFEMLEVTQLQILTPLMFYVPVFRFYEENSSNFPNWVREKWKTSSVQ